MTFLLLIVLVATSTPVGAIHGHAAGEHEHSHASQLIGDAQDGHADDGHRADPGDTIVLHAHDAGAASSALPTVMLPALRDHPLVVPSTRIPLSAPPSAASIPPQRPPIA